MPPTPKKQDKQFALSVTPTTPLRSPHINRKQGASTFVFSAFERSIRAAHDHEG
jgi:hypothetical protein